MSLERFSIKLQNDLKYLHFMADLTENLLKTYGYSDSLTDDMSLSVTELCENAIVHGNQNDKDRFVNVDFELDNSAIAISVTDDGGFFDKNQIEDPTEVDLLKTSGRGIFIVEHLVDDFKYSITDSRRTTIRIMKKV